MENARCKRLDSTGLQYGRTTELYDESSGSNTWLKSFSLGHNNWQLPPCFWIDLATYVAILQQWLHIRSECLEKTPCCHTAVRLSEHGCNPALPEKNCENTKTNDFGKSYFSVTATNTDSIQIWQKVAKAIRKIQNLRFPTRDSCNAENDFYSRKRNASFYVLQKILQNFLAKNKTSNS